MAVTPEILDHLRDIQAATQRGGRAEPTAYSEVYSSLKVIVWKRVARRYLPTSGLRKQRIEEICQDVMLAATAELATCKEVARPSAVAAPCVERHISQLARSKAIDEVRLSVKEKQHFQEQADLSEVEEIAEDVDETLATPVLGPHAARASAVEELNARVIETVLQHARRLDSPSTPVAIHRLARPLIGGDLEAKLRIWERVKINGEDRVQAAIATGVGTNLSRSAITTLANKRISLAKQIVILGALRAAALEPEQRDVFKRFAEMVEEGEDLV